MAIKILDKHVAELIAAGEVVERPSSVVKELVENSIDAGSSGIYVEIERGGIDKIVVQDDGTGIEEADVRKAFVRHATSKIENEEDLSGIHTLGFRGEALASIASVSRLSLVTKTGDRDVGTMIVLSGGEEEDYDVRPFVTGTRITVRDLFFNTPARMKFLKKDSTEAGYVQEIVTDLALSTPEVAFTFVRDGRQVFSTPGDGDLLNAIASIFGTRFTEDLIPVSYTDGKYSVEGYTTIPFQSRNSRNMQFSFINGRFVRNRTVTAASENAYKDTNMVGRFPGYVLKISMPYDAVDVNVHPGKTEVRFANDGEVYGAVYRAVKLAVEGDTHLKKFEFAPVKRLDTPEIDVKQITLTDNSSENGADVSKTAISLEPLGDKGTEFITRFYMTGGTIPAAESSGSQGGTYPGVRSDTFMKAPSASRNQPDNDTVYSLEDYRKAAASLDSPYPEETAQDNFRQVEADDIHVLGQVFDTYVLCTVNDEFIIIDKHAAHERMLYEDLKNNVKTEKQLLLAPVRVKLSASEKEAMLDNTVLLDGMGFEFEDFGDNGILLRSIPMYIEDTRPLDLILEIAYNLSQGNRNDLSSSIEWIFHSVACRSAIKGGDRSETEQLVALVRDIKNKKVPLYCPHGRPVLVTISRKELEKQFGR